MLGLFGRFCPPDLVRQQRRATAQADRWIEAELQEALRVPGRYDVTVTVSGQELREARRVENRIARLVGAVVS